MSSAHYSLRGNFNDIGRHLRGTVDGDRELIVGGGLEWAGKDEEEGGHTGSLVAEIPVNRVPLDGPVRNGEFCEEGTGPVGYGRWRGTNSLGHCLDRATVLATTKVKRK